MFKFTYKDNDKTKKKESVKFYRLLSNFIFLHLKFNFDKNSF